MNTLDRLQQWYLDQCDDEWEHSFGIKIDTLDNPGWSVTIDLNDTNLANKPFQEISNLGPKSDWIRCWKEGTKFKGVCGPKNLQEILKTFTDWADI